MVRFLKSLVLLPIAILVILVAVANRDPVRLSLDPFSPDPVFSVMLPLYAILFGAVALGIVGDCRGVLKGTGKRQVTLMERGDWEAATAELGLVLPWWERRCNLLVDGLDLPRRAGARLRIGRDVMLEVTVEDDPCVRMDAVAPGLFAALIPDWRGGACARVISGGWIAVGDVIEVEQ